MGWRRGRRVSFEPARRRRTPAESPSPQGGSNSSIPRADASGFSGGSGSYVAQLFLPLQFLLLFALAVKVIADDALFVLHHTSKLFDLKSALSGAFNRHAKCVIQIRTSTQPFLGVLFWFNGGFRLGALGF